MLLNRRYNLKEFRTIILKLITVGLLAFLAVFNYLIFHTAVEMIAITIAALVYVLSTQTFEYSSDKFLYFLGHVYLFLAILNFFHLITYYGMGIIPELGPNVPTQLYIALRFLCAVSFFLAPFFYKRPFSRIVMVVVYTIYTLAVLLIIFWLRMFPDCFIEGQGLTSFKIISEYIISLLFIAAIINLYLHSSYINQYVYSTITHALIINILAEVVFTIYSNVYGLSNFIGHILIIFSEYIVYRGIVAQGLRRPYHTIFKKLNDSNEKLENTNQFKTDFLANMSHEMRTPLTAILAFSEDLLAENIGSLNKLQRESIQDIVFSGKQLLDLINNLLDLSKIESGKTLLTLTEVEVHMILSEEIRRLSPLARAKNVNINLWGTEFKIIADEEKVREVIRNLVSNAIKFSHKGDSIEIRLKNTYLESEGILIEIEDNGIGIPETEQSKIFEAFYQVERGLNKKYGGTGLGLALVRKIMDLHHGRIWLKSCEEKGCTFFVFWPTFPSLDEEVV